ncbi:hypothetical protein ALT721_520009 [Alteromonas alvinellae]
MKLAGSMSVLASAIRQSREFAAKAPIATATKRNVFNNLKLPI